MNGDTGEWIIKLNIAVGELIKRVNELEVKVDNLRVQFDTHNHPYKSEPRYG